MDKKLILLLMLVTVVNFGIFAAKTAKKSEPVLQQEQFTRINVVEPTPVPVQPVKPKIEPEFQNYPLVRSLDNSLGKVLSDIDAHMPAGHIYRDSDKITWAHETSHGIHSNARMKFSNGKKINAFYVLENKIVVIEEPDTRIRTVASRVPSSLRGGVFSLYLVQQAGSWDDTPLYIFDEWSAYTNGSACRLDLGIRDRSETVQYMLEFNVYSSCVAWTSGSNDPQLKAFLTWQIERAMKIYKDSAELGNLQNSDSYLEKMRTSTDAAQWRGFCKQYFGIEWCRDVLGF
jgi:hypothetical protein